MPAGRSPLSALLESLTSSDYLSQVDSNSSLLLCWSSSISGGNLSKVQFWSCVVDRCDLQDQQIWTPSPHIFGVTATNFTFTFAYGFMRNETSADYQWAMCHKREVLLAYGLRSALTFVSDRELALIYALAEMFPSAHFLLCQWHISKNILAKQWTNLKH